MPPLLHGFTTGQSFVFVEHVGSSKPSAQSHVFGALHTPPLLHGGVHTGVEQVAPINPVAVQSHVFGALHTPPLLHCGEHIGVIQSGWFHPALHVHVFGPVHAPTAIAALQLDAQEKDEHARSE